MCDWPPCRTAKIEISGLCDSIGVSLSYPDQIPNEPPISPTRMGLFGRSDYEAIAFQCEKAKQLSWKCGVPCKINRFDKAARSI
jgi:hypothetical protein